MRSNRLAALLTLCLVAASVQACAMTDLPESQLAEPGPWPDLGQRRAAAGQSEGVLTPEQQQAAIEELKNRRP